VEPANWALPKLNTPPSVAFALQVVVGIGGFGVIGLGDGHLAAHAASAWQAERRQLALRLLGGRS
jgi:hypothetical protein